MAGKTAAENNTLSDLNEFEKDEEELRKKEHDLLGTPDDHLLTHEVLSPGIGTGVANGIGKGGVESTPNGYTVASSKFDYFFGKVTTGDPHNIARSAQNLSNLNTLGIYDEQALITIFNKAASDGVEVSQKTNGFGTIVTKNIAIENKGSIDVGFFYQEGDLQSTPQIITLIPKIATK